MSTRIDSTSTTDIVEVCVYTCDRCGIEQSVDAFFGDPQGWVEISVEAKAQYDFCSMEHLIGWANSMLVSR